MTTLYIKEKGKYYSYAQTDAFKGLKNGIYMVKIAGGKPNGPLELKYSAVNFLIAPDTGLPVVLTIQGADRSTVAKRPVVRGEVPDEG